MGLSESITLDDRLLELRGGSAVDVEGRPARTHVRPLAKLQCPSRRNHVFTLVAVRILTGRKHQIRVHLSNAGFPVVCDARYGRTRLIGDLEWCERTFLHRYRLTYTDLSLTDREIIEPLPEDLKRALGQLRAVD